MRTQSGPTASESLCRRPEFRYFPPEDFARLDYGRLLWTNHRHLLLAHWEDERHPGKARFERHRALITDLMEAPVAELDAVAARHAISLRGAIREIPVAFGQFWEQSGAGES
jgi:hypothetical protein